MSLASQALSAGLEPVIVSAHAVDPWPRILEALATGALVCADDLDAAPGMAPNALPATGTLIASLTVASAGAFRGPGPLFHLRPSGVVLWPGTPGSEGALGVCVCAPGERGTRGPLGRGTVVHGGSTVAVQCAAPGKNV
jgi:hypothetical protein